MEFQTSEPLPLRKINAKSLFFLVMTIFMVADPICAKKKAPMGTMIGPTGISGLYQPKWPKTPKEIKVTEIEKGSPASGTELKPGDLIVGFGKEMFKKNPLWHLAEAIEKAESSDGSMPLLLKSGKEVNIKLDPIGAYSSTAPYDCPKSNKIITRAAEALLKSKSGGGATKTHLLGLMATGEKKYIDIVKEKIYSGGLLTPDSKSIDDYLNGGENKFGSSGWSWGYNLITLGEYYLLTKDEKALPAIRIYSLALARGQDALGLWGHKMARAPKHRAPGYGTMNQPSISNLIGMMIAQKCGIKDPVLDKAVEKTYACISNVAGKGGFSYGSGGAYTQYFNNNGTSGSGAMAMALNGNQEGATFFSKAAATSYNNLTSGHASSFFNPLWTPLGTSLSGPEVTHEFFRRSLWYFNGERHWKGGFPQKTSAGAVAGQALLTYCLPRKALLITGREADPSIYVKGQEVEQVIMMSQGNYDKKSIDELVKLLHHPFIQVRTKAIKPLARKLKDEVVKKKVMSSIVDGDDQTKINVLSLMSSCPKDFALDYSAWIGKILRNKKESLIVRVEAAKTISNSIFQNVHAEYFADILTLIIEDELQPDRFRQKDNTLGKSVAAILWAKGSTVKTFDMELKIDKELIYAAANKLLSHKKRKAREAGTGLLLGMPKEDFHKIGKELMHVLKDEDPGYFDYSSAINVPGMTLLAKMNIKEGLDLLHHAIYHGGGKWAFKYRALMNTLPHYGANAEPYISKFEAHRSINKKGDRFTPAWQKVVKKIREDKKPPKLMTFEEAMKIGASK